MGLFLALIFIFTSLNNTQDPQTSKVWLKKDHTAYQICAKSDMLFFDKFRANNTQKWRLRNKSVNSEECM